MTFINPILLSIPESFESNRLLLRAPQWGDGAMVNEAIKESVVELRPWMPFAREVQTIEETEIVSRKGRVSYLERSDLRLLLIHKTTGKFVGSSGLHRIDWQVRKFEVGYWVATPFSGQGYITEAVESITNFAINELQANRIEIRCDSRNLPSARVAERLGFTLEGTLRNDSLDVEGAIRNTLLFSKVRGVEF